MLELTPANAVAYLRQQGWIGPGAATVEALGWGVSNAVFRVQTPERLFVLKQSRPQLRTRDAWFSNLDRVYRELEVMQVLHPLLPPLTVPEVLHVDRANYVFAMAHAPLSARVWKEQLLAGEVDLALAEQVGRVLGQMHQATAHIPALVERFQDHAVYIQLRVDPFYRRVQERRPEVAEAIAPIIERMLSLRQGLCHGDYTPKNILTHEQGFTLVDYETAHQGDPTMDLGLCLAHLLLKAITRPADPRYLEITRMFWRGYLREADFLPAATLEARGIEHCGVCLLARVDGTSPVDYLPGEAAIEAVRRLGRKLLLDRVKRWDEVVCLAEAEK